MIEEITDHAEIELLNERSDDGEMLPSFENLVTSILHDTLTMVLGEKVAEALYSYILRNFNLRKEEIVMKPEVFSKSVNRLFGRGGRVIQRVIIRNICDRVGVEYSEVWADDLASALIELRKYGGH